MVFVGLLSALTATAGTTLPPAFAGTIDTVLNFETTGVTLVKKSVSLVTVTLNFLLLVAETVGTATVPEAVIVCLWFATSEAFALRALVCVT